VKAFALEPEQISRVIAGIIADELGFRFNRYVDFLSLARWTGETPLLLSGVDLNFEERAVCARAVERHFGAPSGVLDESPGETIGDWSASVSAHIVTQLSTIAFTAAGRDSATQASAHPAAEVFRDAAAAANLLLGRRRVVYLVAPHGYLAFAVSILAPNLMRIASADARGMAPEELVGFLSFGDALVATPTIWRYLMNEGVRAPDNAIGVVFGEPLTADLAADMRKNGFGAIRELYGSTENGLVAWRDSPNEPFTLLDHWRRDGQALARLLATGDESRVAPMDRCDWADERSFRLGPRLDGAVQVGAINVRPRRVEEVIRAHPAVAECAVEAVRQLNGLNRLVARVALTPGHAPTERVARDIDAWCRSRLRPPERPRIYHFEE
jgi:4-coumarate--CoA ligase (photoactive yellow protein activation family)